MKKKFWLFLLVAGLGLLIYFVFIKNFLGSEEKSVTETAGLPSLTEEQKKVLSEEITPVPDYMQMEIDKNKNYEAILKTSMGDISLQLNASQTPVTVNNFVKLARKGFYTNTVFHRAIKGFMIQGGDPKGDGTGGPGYMFADEPFVGDYKRGVLAMANAGQNTNGSQFFILQSDYDLPKQYVIFGKVIKGVEVVDKIAEAPVEKNSFGEPSKPVKPVVIKSVEILEK